MKNKKQKESINQLRDELHRLIECEHLNSETVQKRSQELDELVLLYYKQAQETKEIREIK